MKEFRRDGHLSEFVDVMEAAQALRACLSGESQSEDASRAELRMASYALLGDVFLAFSDAHEALEWYSKWRSAAQSVGDTKAISMSAERCAVCYSQLERPDAALSLLKEALPGAKEVDNGRSESR